MGLTPEQSALLTAHGAEGETRTPELAVFLTELHALCERHGFDLATNPSRDCAIDVVPVAMSSDPLLGDVVARWPELHWLLP